MSSPEAELSALKARAQQAQAEYQRSLARIEGKKEDAKQAAMALKEFGVSNLTEAAELVASLEAEVEESLAKAREVLA